MLRIAICDDDKAYCEVEKDVIATHLRKLQTDFEITIFNDGDSLETVFVQNAFDLVMLDVEMRTSNGVEIARRIRERDQQVYIAFVSSYIDYSPMGYEVNAIRYILKDDYITTNIPACLDYVIKLINKSNYTILVKLKDSSLVKKILVREIVFIESSRHYLKIHMNNGAIYETRGGITDYARELAPYSFVRIYKSYVVSLAYVEAIDNKNCYIDGIKLSISRDYYSDVYNKYCFYREV